MAGAGGVVLNPDYAAGLSDAVVRGLSVYDEVEIEDMVYDDVTDTFSYPCPCGDRFVITQTQLARGDDIARCPSCSLTVRVIYELVDD